jgi:hypothetical protein
MLKPTAAESQLEQKHARFYLLRGSEFVQHEAFPVTFSTPLIEPYGKK